MNERFDRINDRSIDLLIGCVDTERREAHHCAGADQRPGTAPPIGSISATTPPAASSFSASH
jgi:hypothetical protein